MLAVTLNLLAGIMRKIRKGAPKMGRPFGIPREGTYGIGVETSLVRVPARLKDRVPHIVKGLPEIISKYRKEQKNTRNWVVAVRLLDELEDLINDEK